MKIYHQLVGCGGWDFAPYGADVLEAGQVDTCRPHSASQCWWDKCDGAPHCDMRGDLYPSSSSSSSSGSTRTSRGGSASSLLSDKTQKMSAIYGYSRSLVPRRKIDTPSSEVLEHNPF